MADYKCNKPYSTSWNGVKSKYEIIPDNTKPLPPRNVFVTSPYIIGVLDIRWDNPLEIPENNSWQILGVNVYRSEDSECGPFVKINSSPVETLYYRDKTINKIVVNEDVMPRLNKGQNARADWFFRTAHTPIVLENSQSILVEDPRDIVVKIDNGDGQGLLPIPPLKIYAEKGEVHLITKKVYNPKTKRYEEPRLPTGDNAKCTCTYRYNLQLIRSDLHPRFFYKLTTVGRDNNGNILETSLDAMYPAHVHQIEKPHYIWQGIIAKNRYLLEQLGERVKVFMRKEVGEKCPNYSFTHEQAHNHCNICYGTGIVGGYDGPVDIMIASPEAEKHITLTDIGLKLNFTYESWMGPSPLIRTRDFVVRQNNERLMVGSVTPQGAKGSVFQQHFMLNYRDSKDIIYNVPINGTSSESCNISSDQVPVADDTRDVNKPITDASPVIPDHKNNKPRSKTDKGRTIDYENVVW